MKAIWIAAALVAAAGAAQAQSYTISWVSKVANRVDAPETGGDTVGAVFTNITGTVDLGGGRTVPITGQCATWTANPKTDLFERNGACLVSGPQGGKASWVYGCDWDSKEHLAQSCWGYASGLGGPIDKKVGELSWRTVLDADKNGAKTTGTGQWN